MAMKPDYKVELIGPAKEQTHTLADRAAAVGIVQEYLQAWNAILTELRTRPREWGDPEWSTRKPGGMVYHGTVDPLFVRYVVYEQERYVCILKVMPMSHSRLD
jgi:hypothetical protein